MPLNLDNLKLARAYNDWNMFLQRMMNLKQHCACQIARILGVAARETCKTDATQLGQSAAEIWGFSM